MAAGVALVSGFRYNALIPMRRINAVTYLRPTCGYSAPCASRSRLSMSRNLRAPMTASLTNFPVASRIRGASRGPPKAPIDTTLVA